MLTAGDRRSAETLLDQVMTRLEREFTDVDKQSQFRQLKPFIIGQHEGATYADAGPGFPSTPGFCEISS